MSEEKYLHSEKLPLSLVVAESEKETDLIEKALQILAIEDAGSSYTPVTAISGLINHWLVNRDLACYIRNERVDIAALEVIAVDGDFGKGLDALEAWITISKEELTALLESRHLPIPKFLSVSTRPSITGMEWGSDYLTIHEAASRLAGNDDSNQLLWFKWRDHLLQAANDGDLIVRHHENKVPWKLKFERVKISDLNVCVSVIDLNKWLEKISVENRLPRSYGQIWCMVDL